MFGYRDGWMEGEREREMEDQFTCLARWKKGGRGEVERKESSQDIKLHAFIYEMSPALSYL